MTIFDTLVAKLFIFGAIGTNLLPGSGAATVGVVGLNAWLPIVSFGIVGKGALGLLEATASFGAGVVNLGAGDRITGFTAGPV